MSATPVVAEVGDDRERVVEPVVGEAVGAVAEPDAAGRRSCRGDLPGQRAGASGAAARDGQPGQPAPPARAVSAPWSAGSPVMPGADGGADPPGRGSADRRGPAAAPYRAAYQPASRGQPAPRPAGRAAGDGRSAATARRAGQGGARAARRPRAGAPRARDSAVTV